MPPRPPPKAKPPPRRAVEFPPRLSSGYLVRDAHRAFQRLLERRIAALRRDAWPMVFPARAVDHRRAVAARIVGAGRHDGADHGDRAAQHGATGLIRRVRSDDDRRKVRVSLTAKAKRLRSELLAVARTITDEAEEGIAPRDLAAFRRVIARMTANLDRIER